MPEQAADPHLAVKVEVEGLKILADKVANKKLSINSNWSRIYVLASFPEVIYHIIPALL